MFHNLHTSGVIIFILILMLTAGVLIVNYLPKNILASLSLIKGKWWFGYLIALLILLLVLILLDIKYEIFGSPEKIENIIAELHGLVFDLFLFGIIFTIYDRIRDKKGEIARYLEELDDYKYWKGEESTFRRIGIIKRLLKLAREKINIIDHEFENGKFISLDIAKLIIKRTKFTHCGFENCNFTNGQINHVWFIESIFTNINFSFASSALFFKKSKFSKSKFSDTDFTAVDFEECNFRSCEFVNCDLSFANFKNSVFYGDHSFAGCTFHSTDFEGVFFPELRRDELIIKFKSWFGEQIAEEIILSKYQILNLDDPEPLEVEHLFPIGAPRKFKKKQQGCFLYKMPKNPFRG